MSNVAVIEPREVRTRSVLGDMAERYGMDPRPFEATVRATCIKADKNGRVATQEEFAAFLLVAKQYDLNPLTKEIYAFASKGGGVVPIVGVDGWANLINRHPQFDGMEFDDVADTKGSLTSITCRMYRKDRGHPVCVTEYMSECKRDTEVWRQWPRRMLRHKTMIQAARYAFGFAGIYDEDEAERIMSVRDTRPAPPNPNAAQIAAPAPAAPVARRPPNPNAPKAPEPAPLDFDGFRAALDAAATLDEANAIYEREITNRQPPLQPDEIDEADALLRECGAKFWEPEAAE